MRPAELHSQSAEENCPTENVSSLRSVKGATLPCAAYAAIPCGLAVCKQHNCCSPPASLISINLEELMIKRMMMALCIFVCTFTLVACSGQQTNEPLTLGVNAIITEIDKENKIITTKDSEEKGVLGNDCLIDCSKIPMIYCNYDTQNVVAITLDDLQVGDEIILTIRNSEIENLQKEDDNKTKIAVEQLQLGTQRIK